MLAIEQWQTAIDCYEVFKGDGLVPEKARWETTLALTPLRTTGRATLVEVEPMREATLGANMRAAIVYEACVRCGDDWKVESLEKMERRVKLCWN